MVLSVILTILKWIGIILLIVLGLILLVIAVVLFVPLRYHAGLVTGEGGQSKIPDASASATWLCRAVGVHAQLTDGELTVRLRILWFTLKKISRRLRRGNEEHETGTKNTETETSLFPANDKKIRPEAYEETSAPDLAGQAKHDAVIEAVQNEVPEEILRNKEENSKKSAKRQIKKNTRNNRNNKSNQKKLTINNSKAAKNDFKESAVSSKKNGSEKGRIGQVLEFLYRIPERIADLIQLAFDLIFRTEDAIDRIGTKLSSLARKAEAFAGADARSVYRLILDKAKRMLHHYRIRRLNGHVAFGLDQPDLTGLLTGFGYLLVSGAKGNFSIEPSFQEAMVDADISLKGHIRLCHALWLGMTLLLNRQVRRMIHVIRRKGEPDPPGSAKRRKNKKSS